MEAGDIILIGATTENPAFHLTNALLSRLRIFRLYALSSDEIKQTLQKALSKFSLKMSEASLQLISSHASGDARKALSWLDEWLLLHKQGIEEAKALAQVLADQPKAMDKNGDWFYEMLSAFHKSLRGSNVDGAMYWFARMIDAGMDALIIARRMLCVASEDIGNADPNALNLALNAYMTYERLGSPEGHLALAQALTYLALAPKSNASYHAMNEAFAYVRNHPSYSVPNHLRNAPTALHQIQGYGKGYRYAHHEPNAYAAGQTYLPKEMLDKHNQPKVSFYQPNERGFEIKLANKLRYLQELDLQTQNYK
nr:replication-associated recombination protein A [Rappaport israeli]